MDADDYLALSGVQHYVFCPRQWALIHIEGLWAENAHTVLGNIDHERCHDGGIREKRGDILTVRGFRVVSHALKLQGICDVLELRADPDGIEIVGESQRYRPIPIEYKHGKAKLGQEDKAQLCAQAMALEEMLCCDIPTGFLYYVSERHREEVALTQELRDLTRNVAAQMQKTFRTGLTPAPKKKKCCRSCSLKEECIPELETTANVSRYISEAIEEESR